MQIQRKQVNSFLPLEWVSALRRVFLNVGVTLITQKSKSKGAWKLGKTDLSLFISECLLQLNIVSEVATNINTYGHYPFITDLISLKQWLHEKKTRKLFIFDELNVHAMRRRAMSGKSIGILEIIPEISKARARLIGVGHDVLGIDKELLKDAWTRSLFIKTNLKRVRLVSLSLSDPLTFNNLPRTSIQFDPYERAPFTEKPFHGITFKDEDLTKLWNWVNGGRWKDMFSNPNECNRFVRKNVRRLLEKRFTDLQK